MLNRTTNTNYLYAAFIALLITLLTACSGSSDTSTQSNPRSGEIEKYVIQCQADCDNIANAINELGGTIKLAYKNVNALAVSLPVEILEQVQEISNVKGMAKDRVINSPTPESKTSVTFPQNTQTFNLQGTGLKQLLTSAPADFNFNNVLTGASVLHSNDQTGKDVIVAVIDSGTANNADIVPTLAGSVIGGENFVLLENEPSATSILNNPHGTWVAGVIASHAALIIPTEENLVQALLTHSPASVLPNDATTSIIPVIGVAPEASIYAMKVFPAEGSGTRASVVMEAMDRVITLKENYDDEQETEIRSGDGSEDNPFVYSALNIQVVNMSLGGPTLFPGLNVEDILTRKMLKAGINVIVSSGNSGAAALTTSSPSTGVGSLTIGAANTPIHERILVDLIFGAGTGMEFRPNNITQVAQFSSRGPVPDGRVGVHLIANGVATFTQGADGNFALVSGTSFSSPTVAGAAALLWHAKPDSNAADIRKALMMSADPDMIANMSMNIDQGNGFLAIPAALEALMNDPDAEIPQLPERDSEPSLVKDNIAEQNLSPVDFDNSEFAMMLDLLPGQVKHFFVPVTPNTMKLDVSLTDVSAELAPENQNQIFGDDLFVTIVDAPTTINDVFVETFVLEDQTFEIMLPQHGLVRVAVMGDWTNAGKVSAKLGIKEMKRELTEPSVTGSLRDEEADIFEVDISDETTSQVTFELSWDHNWGSFPAHDIDLYLIDPLGNLDFHGASFRSPERVVIDDPIPGEWQIVVEGFALHGFRDEYQLRVTDQNQIALEVDD